MTRKALELAPRRLFDPVLLFGRQQRRQERHDGSRNIGRVALCGDRCRAHARRRRTRPSLALSHRTWRLSRRGAASGPPAVGMRHVWSHASQPHIRFLMEVCTIYTHYASVSSPRSTARARCATCQQSTHIPVARLAAKVLFDAEVRRQRRRAQPLGHARLRLRRRGGCVAQLLYACNRRHARRRRLHAGREQLDAH